MSANTGSNSGFELSFIFVYKNDSIEKLLLGMQYYILFLTFNVSDSTHIFKRRNNVFLPFHPNIGEIQSW